MRLREGTLMRNVGRKTETGIRILSLLLGGVAMAILMVMVVFITFDVISRYIFNSPLVGSADITQQLLLGVLFLGLGYSTLHRSHIRMTFVVDRLRPANRRRLNLMMDIVSVVIVAVFAREAYALALRSLEQGENIPYAPFFFPAFWPQLAVALGLTVFALQLSVDTVKQYKGE